MYHVPTSLFVYSEPFWKISIKFDLCGMMAKLGVSLDQYEPKLKITCANSIFQTLCIVHGRNLKNFKGYTKKIYKSVVIGDFSHLVGV